MRRKLHRDGAKHCARCDAWLPLSSYHANRRNWDGLHAYCRSCMADGAKQRYAREGERLAEQAKAWRKANPAKRKDIALRSRFGITLADYNAIAKAQGGVCAVCCQPAVLAVDHCHSTGKVRGLLCMPCNTAIGQFRDDPALLRAAALYVEATR